MSKVGFDQVMELAQRKMIGRMKMFFALLTLLGGLVLALGTDSNATALIAVSFTLVGFVFVDTLRWFALPTPAAYAAMLVVCCYCVSDFFPLDEPSNNQLVAVAQLLALVQSIMMLQHKNRRIFEQLTTFCLLELVVAASFNHALSYGLLLLPLGIAGVLALATLAATHATEAAVIYDDSENELDGDFDEVWSDSRKASALILGLRRAPKKSTFQDDSSSVSWLAPQSISEVARRTPPMLRTTAAMMVPSVMLVAIIFFYALPRTTDAEIEPMGAAAVGFSDQVTLDQIGKMNANAAIALRVDLRDRKTGQPYRVGEQLYLRGRVLDQYSTRMVAGNLAALWTASTLNRADRTRTLPKPLKVSGDEKFDSVLVRVTSESSRSSAMFSLPPYFQADDSSSSDWSHSVTRQTIEHRDAKRVWYRRSRYQMISHALTDGRSSPWIALNAGLPDTDELFQTTPDRDDTQRFVQSRTLLDSRWAENYLRSLTEVDPRRMPTANDLAKRFAKKSNGDLRNPHEFSQAVCNHLATTSEYQYSLDLSFAPSSEMDPIEKFASIDKAGHCQFFASLLAMTLRCQNIPARLVVGYCTDEYNHLSRRYIARGSHAHAWVEALIPAGAIPESQRGDQKMFGGQPDSSSYWLRLDATPAAREQFIGTTSRPQQAIDLASNLWDDYIVEMDRGRQDDAIGSRDSAMHQNYLGFVRRLARTVQRIRTGDLGGGELASSGFSPLAAAVVFGALVFGLLLFRLRPRSIRMRLGRAKIGEATPPRLEFFVETLAQLNRIGVQRTESQTPLEFVQVANEAIDQVKVSGSMQLSSRSPGSTPPVLNTTDAMDDDLKTLADWYYRLRFGRDSSDAGESNQFIDVALAKLRHRIDQL